MKKLITLVLFVLSITPAFALRIFDTHRAEFINQEELINRLPQYGYIVLGEFHNQPSIQKFQSVIIEEVVKKHSLLGNNTIMWEFFDYQDQLKIEAEYANYYRGMSDVTTFITNTAGKNNLTYAPVFQVAKKYSTNVVGLNAKRSVKAELIKKGLQGIDPSLIPPNMEIGGDNYWKRFKAIMGNHVPVDKLERYFLAQCYTDSVMSYYAHVSNTRRMNFVIAGSFHTDFYDGTVSRLKKLRSEPVVSLAIRNRAMLNERQLATLFEESQEYGKLADYIVLTD